MTAGVGVLLPWPQPQPVDAAGVPIVGAQLFSYATGTNTPLATYADGGLGTANLNPLIADEAGRFGLVFLDPSQNYRIVLKDADGAQIWLADPVGYDWVSTLITSMISGAVAVETARAEAAEAALQAAIDAETARAEAAETALQAAIDAETARAEAAEAALAAEDVSLQNQINALGGGGGGGSTRGGSFDLANPFTVTFDPAFAGDCESVQGAYPGVGSPPIFYQPASLSKTGTAGTWVDNFGVPVGGVINWIALGY